MTHTVTYALKTILAGISPLSCLIVLVSSAVQAFGLYNVHALANVTEGGLLGLNLLLEHWFNISPAITNFVVSALCYLWGWKLLGKTFIVYSAVAAVGFSGAYGVFEQFDPLWPQLYDMPFAAALVGALFVGITTGIVVRLGGAVCGDDALAMSISHVTGLRIQWVYLISDLVVLALSATYIPLGRLMYSLLTVVLSGQIIGLMQPREKSNASKPGAQG